MQTTNEQETTSLPNQRERPTFASLTNGKGYIKINHLSPRIYWILGCFLILVGACKSSETQNSSDSQNTTKGYSIDHRSGCEVIRSCSICSYTQLFSETACKSTGWAETVKCGTQTDLVPCEQGTSWFCPLYIVATLSTVALIYWYLRFMKFRTALEDQYRRKALGTSAR